MMDEPAAAGTFDKPLSAVTTGTEWMKENGGRKGVDPHMAARRQTAADGRWSEGGEEGVGGCKKKKKKDCRSICGIDNMVSAPRWGDVTGWQVGCCCLCHWLGDQGRHAETPATQTPGSEAYDCCRDRGDTWTRCGTHTHTPAHARTRTHTHGWCKVTSPIANYRHRASIRSRGSKLHGSTTTRAMCPGVICQTNYLSWACNCGENRYSGNCVVSCNVKWCFPSIFRRDERSKDCSAEIRCSIWPPSQARESKNICHRWIPGLWGEKKSNLMSLDRRQRALATSWNICK